MDQLTRAGLLIRKRRANPSITLPTVAEAAKAIGKKRSISFEQIQSPAGQQAQRLLAEGNDVLCAEGGGAA